MKSFTLIALIALAAFASAASRVQVAENLDMDVIAVRQIPVPAPEGCSGCVHSNSAAARRLCPAGTVSRVEVRCLLRRLSKDKSSFCCCVHADLGNFLGRLRNLLHAEVIARLA